MTGINELQVTKNWIAANRAWLAVTVIASLALMIFSLYFVTAARQSTAPSATALMPPNTSSIKPIQQTSLQVTSLATNDQPPSTTVKINNQPVDVPSTGVVHQVINNPNGTTSVNISSDSKSSGTGSSNSSMNIEVNSVSQSSSTTESRQ